MPALCSRMAAAIAFGWQPETMRRHGIKRDETVISDGVMDRMRADG